MSPSPTGFEHLTFSALDLDLPLMAQTFEQHRCLLLRQIFTPALMVSFGERAHQAFTRWDYQKANGLLSPELAEGYRFNFLPVSELDQPDERLLQAIWMFMGTPLVDLMNTIYDKQGFQIAMANTTIRRQIHTDQAMFTPFHQDGYFLDPSYRIMTCWAPLVSCGADAPSLEVIPAGLNDIRPRHNPYGEHARDNTDLDMDADILPYFSPETFWHPLLEPGDAILYDAFTIHRTYWLPHMQKPRYNLEIRVIPLVEIPPERRFGGFLEVPPESIGTSW